MQKKINHGRLEKKIDVLSYEEHDREDGLKILEALFSSQTFEII